MMTMGDQIAGKPGYRDTFKRGELSRLARFASLRANRVTETENRDMSRYAVSPLGTPLPGGVR